jgi:hypothetical protein
MSLFNNFVDWVEMASAEVNAARGTATEEQLSLLSSDSESEDDVEVSSKGRASKGGSKGDRVDGASVRKDFTKAIQEKGGDGRGQAKATEAMSQGLFGCRTKQVYEVTGGKSGDRSTLPPEVQKAYLVGETVATHAIRDKDYAGSQEEINDGIAETVEETTFGIARLFPWNW